MNSPRALQQTIGLTLVVLLLAGCAGVTPNLTAAPTSTPVLPVLTDGTNSWRLTSVTTTTSRKVNTATGEQTIRAAEGQVFLKIEFRCVRETDRPLLKLTSDKGGLGNIYLTDSQNKKHPAVAIQGPTGTCATDYIWVQVPEGSHGFQLHFADLPPLDLPK